MYSSVWNRVALLAAGMAVGWNLVNLMVVRPDAQQAQRIKVIAGALGGVVVIVALGITSPAAATMGIAIFAISGLVAYAGNARHATNPPPTLPLLQPARPLERDARRSVLLVHPGEPATYDGPLPWARRLARWQTDGKSVPHWFRQPALYARIRNAMSAMHNEASIHATLLSLGQTLQTALGDDHRVELAFLTCDPILVKQLTRIAEDGLGQVDVIPLGLDTTDTELLRAEILRSRVREVGLRVNVLDAQPCPLPDAYGPRFERLQRGETPAALDVNIAAWTSDLARALGSDSPEA